MTHWNGDDWTDEATWHQMPCRCGHSRVEHAHKRDHCHPAGSTVPPIEGGPLTDPCPCPTFTQRQRKVGQ